MKIIEISDVRTAKDGRKYFVATFRPGLGQRPVNRTFWEQFKNDANGDRTDKKYWERMSPDEAVEAINNKESIEATKVTKSVEPYQIGDKFVPTYSTVLFPDENVETLFRSQNHPIVDEETGELLAAKVKVVIAPGNKPTELVKEEKEA